MLYRYLINVHSIASPAQYWLLMQLNNMETIKTRKFQYMYNMMLILKVANVLQIIVNNYNLKQLQQLLPNNSELPTDIYKPRTNEIILGILDISTNCY